MIKHYATDAATVILHFRRPLAIIVQLLLVVASNWLAFMLRFDGRLPPGAAATYEGTIVLLLVTRAIAFIPFRLYQGLWRYTSVDDLVRMIGGIGTSSVAFVILIHTPIWNASYPHSVLLIDAVLLTLLLGGARLMRRLYVQFDRTSPRKRVLVYGAGDAGELVVRDMKHNAWYNYQPVGFVDDDKVKVGRSIHGVPVLGTRDDLSSILERYRPHEVLLAMPRAEPPAVRAIVSSLEPYKIPIKTLPNLRDLIDGKIELAQIRSLAVDDLLARAPIGLDPAPVRELIKGRRVMVTGAGGSIGSELCRQIVRLKPASLVLFERYENTLHAIRLELEDTKPGCGLHPVIGDVADTACVAATLQRHRPDIIFHAAAHKHVPLMEENPCEAIKNNVRGTRLLARAAEDHGVDRFIMISTDKAVNPTSVMGASKRLAELAVQTQAVGSGTSFAIVRFGNVLGSNGSVVPRFMEQIKKGGPVTITHPDMRRFFMLIPEAVQLVLHAAAQADGGATYVLEMGEQVRLVDMARDLIRLSGLVPDKDVPIEFIGLRPGEKLYEELVGTNEVAGPSAVDKIVRVTSRTPPAPGLLQRLETIEAQAATSDVASVMASLKTLIPEYQDPAAVPNAPAAKVEPRPAAAPVFPTAGDMLNPECPQCKTARVHRSHARSIAERMQRRFSVECLFRCGNCGWRGWLLPLVYVAPATVGETAAPNLSTLDAVFQPQPAELRPNFSPRNLQ